MQLQPPPLNLTRPIMQNSRNSLVHRNLLCGDISKAQCVDCSLERPPCSQSFGPNGGFDEHAPPTPTFAALMLTPDCAPPVFHPMDPMAYGYYIDDSMYTLNFPRFPHCPTTADGSFTTDPCDSLAPTYQQPLDTSASLREMFSELVAAHYPSTPPAAPEQSIALNPLFCYYPCRWLGGPECDGSAPGKNREMGEHLRSFHRFLGNERDSVPCEWEGCSQTMQRMNISRHIVSRHLLAAARCRFCGKRFSRPDVVSRHERTCTVTSPVSSRLISKV